MRRHPLLHACRATLPTLLLASLAAACLAGSSRAAAAPAAVSGLVGAYSFDATSGTSVADSSGSGNTGTLSGPVWTAGKTGNALSFDGINDWVTIADAASLDLTSGMTLEAWVKPTAKDDIWRTVVTKETRGNLTYGLFSNSDTRQPVGISTIGSSALQSIVRGTGPTAAGAWTHLATTYNGATLRLYANGAQVASQAVTGAMANSAGALRIGGNAIWAEWFSGQIDDLRIYNKALTAAQVKTDMNTPVAPSAPADTQAPTAPGGLVASAQAQTQITLSWTASTDNVGVTGYSRYQAGTLISSGTGTSFTFTGLTCGTSYMLAVDAYDAAGNRSTRPSLSASTSACTPPPPDTQAPTAPGGLIAGGQTQTQITVSWNASTDNVGVTGYSRYRAGALISSGTGTSFTFTGLTCGTSYVLAVDAYDAAGNRSTRPSLAAATQPCATPPVAAYSFDAGSGTSLTDNSGNGNTGAISGATWTTAGKSGRALTFDGVSDLVTVADKASLDLTTGMTLEAWIRPTANSVWRTVVTKETSGNLTYGLFSNSDVPQPSSIVTIGASAVQDVTTGTTEVPLSSWAHLATTYDGSVLRLYVNGTQVATKNVTGAMASSTGPLQIGGNNVWSEWFQGQIDDLRIYDRALSPSELQTDMNNPVAPPPAADTQVPTAPAGLAASGQTQTQATLSWNASSDNVGVAGYSYYRDGILIGNGTATSYTFTGLACGTSYTLAVEAYDAAGNRSVRPSVNASTSACPPPPPADTQAPTAPAGLVASGQTQTQITLSWNASTDDVGVTGYSRYRAGTLISSGTGTSFAFTGLACGTSYTLAVDAYDAAGNRSTRPSVTASTTACASGGSASVYLSTGGSDSNACTQAAPCKSFDRAYRVAAPGATVEVAAGSYPAQTIATDSSKTSASDVIFRPASGASVVLGDLTVLADHLEIRDMRVTSSVATKTSTDDITLRNIDMLGFFIEGSSNVTLLGGRVHCGVCDYHSQISAEYGVNVAPTNLVIDGVLFEDWQAASSGQHTECLQIGGGNGITIRNSTFRECATQTPNNATSNIHVSWYGFGPMTRNVTIENNFIYESGNPFSIQALDYPGLRIRYNSIVGPIVVFGGQGDGSPVEITGNILRYTAGMCTAQPLGSGSGGPYAALNWRYNVISGGTCGATDKNAAYGYTNQLSNLHLLAGATAINNGDPSSYPATDIDGNTRSATPDAGADER